MPRGGKGGKRLGVRGREQPTAGAPVGLVGGSPPAVGSGKAVEPQSKAGCLGRRSPPREGETNKNMCIYIYIWIPGILAALRPAPNHPTPAVCARFAQVSWQSPTPVQQSVVKTTCPGGALHFGARRAPSALHFGARRAPKWHGGGLPCVHDFNFPGSPQHQCTNQKP